MIHTALVHINSIANVLLLFNNWEDGQLLLFTHKIWMEIRTKSIGNMPVKETFQLKYTGITRKADPIN